MRTVRLLGFIVAGLAAVAAFVFLGPDDIERIQPPSIEGLDELVEQALSDYDENSLAAGDNAELQIVTNGWVARDLLFILVSELEVMSDQMTVLSAQIDGIARGTEPDERVPALLLIGVLTFGLHAATLSPASAVREKRTAVPARTPPRKPSDSDSPTDI